MQTDPFKSILRPRIREQLPKALKEASPIQLARALIENHRAWRVRLARAGKGTVITRSGLDWMHTPNIETGIAITGIAEEEAETQLTDAFTFFSRKRNPIPVTITAGDSSGPPDLMGRLAAWGIQPTFQPGLAANLNALNKNLEHLPKLTLSFTQETDTHPEWHPQIHRIYERTQTMRPKRVWHLVAHHKRKQVGHITLHIGAGVVGLYDLIVHPDVRRQTIGTTLTLGACLFAKKLGYHYAVLTTPQTALFRHIGFGKVNQMLITTQPSTDLRGRPHERDLAIAQAASLGERGRFCKLLHQYPKALTWKSRAGLTPLHIAIAAGRPDFACWLIDRGATIDAQTAHELGLK
jgi:N-acetylglutamate synthase-like GNAT family acetyltransferase